MNKLTCEGLIHLSIHLLISALDCFLFQTLSFMSTISGGSAARPLVNILVLCSPAAGKTPPQRCSELSLEGQERFCLENIGTLAHVTQQLGLSAALQGGASRRQQRSGTASEAQL